MRQWARRARQLHGELAELADVDDPRWWVVAGGAALAWTDRAAYVASDGDASTDTFIGARRERAWDAVTDAIARAHAARAALRELDGTLPDQPLAVIIRRGDVGAQVVPSTLDVAAFAIGETCWCARLGTQVEHERELVADLQAVLDGHPPRTLVRLADATTTPFVCVSIGDEPLETARHGHRRAWRTIPASGASAREQGPWLGLGTAGDLALVSTCHLIIDGHGHALLAARIAELADQLAPHVPAHAGDQSGEIARALATLADDQPAPPLATVPGAQPLAITWRPLARPLRALPVAYALGCLLHRTAGAAHARFSPTVQIPVAPGALDDPGRARRRVVPAITSVRFSAGEPEPFATFATRSKQTLAREARGDGVVSRLLAAARAVPAPLWWKRHAISVNRPRWLEPVADVLGGRGCVSRIELPRSIAPSCAVSSPAQLASAHDPLGSCVVTLIDDGTRAAITLCGSGDAASPALLDELVALATLAAG